MNTITIFFFLFLIQAGIQQSDQTRTEFEESTTPDSIANDLSVLRGQPINLLQQDSLEGWTNGNGKPAGKGWSVKEGVLHRGRNRGGDLYHEYWYRDFDLTLDFKIAEKGNSGIKYRVQKYDGSSLGCEFQIQDDRNNHHTKQSTGGLYAVYEPNENKQPIQPMEWNTIRIVVVGQKIEHWLNGELVVNANCGSLDWLKRVENSKFKNREFFGQNREGRIFLQDHGSEVWYRNIVVTPLASD